MLFPHQVSNTHASRTGPHNAARGSHGGAAARLAAMTLWVCTSACQGEIGSFPSGPGATAEAASAAGAAGSLPRADAVDDALRSEDAALFARASQYFPGTEPSAAPARLARLSRLQLDRTAQALLPKYYEASAVVGLPRDPLQTNYEYAENLRFSAANFTPFTTWVRSMADRAREDPSGVVDCAGKANDAACLERAAQAFVRRAFRGVANDAQLRRFSSFFSASVADVGLPQASADLVDVVLTSPSFAFRAELPAGTDGMLDAPSFLQTLSYTLADAPPEALGLALDASETVVRDSALRKQTIDRWLLSPEAKAKLLRFFFAWLEVREPGEFTIASEVFPEFTPALAAAMVDETRAFLERTLGASAPSLRDVTQSTRSIVSEGLRAIYGLDRATADGWTSLSTKERLGIFTQPAVLASHSGPSTTRLVKRGVFFTRKVMCLPLGNPPQGVDTSLTDQSFSTERERIEQGTRAPACQGCHASINPFGFMQESYDPIGRYRRDEGGRPINTKVTFTMLDEAVVSTESPVDALRAITGSARFQQCFVRQLFRFYMGRDEQPGDDPVLREMFFRFAKNETQDIAMALRTLAHSAAMSTRRQQP
ncbi:MAG: hypothetical protein RL385_390 [Pseudomonadota bacterium]|jgi:hypothetical protein